MVVIRVLASDSAGNACVIDDGRTRLLLDAGISWKRIQQKMNFLTSGLSGALITHSHNDHSAAVKNVMSAGINVYLSAATAGALELVGHRVKIIVPYESFKVGTFIVLPISLEHDVPTLGFLLASGKEKIVYITDTAYCRYRFRALTHIMIECNYSSDILRENVANGTVSISLQNRIVRTHMSLDTVKNFLHANDLRLVETIHLLHLSDDNSDSDRFLQEIQTLTGKPTYIAPRSR